MKFSDYVNQNGVPDHVVCLDRIPRYQKIPRKYFNLPVVQGMLVDHVQVDMENNTGRIVFLRCPDRVNAV